MEHFQTYIHTGILFLHICHTSRYKCLVIPILSAHMFSKEASQWDASYEHKQNNKTGEQNISQFYAQNYVHMDIYPTKKEVHHYAIPIKTRRFFIFLATQALLDWTHLIMGNKPFVERVACCISSGSALFQRLKYTLIRKVYLWPLKTYNGQSHPYCSYLMGKSIFSESREKTLYKQDSHIYKICLPYKIPIIFLIWSASFKLYWIWTSVSGDVT